MFTIFTTYLVHQNCPECVNADNCAVRTYLAKEQNLFRPSVNEQLWEPTKSYEDARDDYIKTLDAIHAKCKQCKEKGSK